MIKKEVWFNRVKFTRLPSNTLAIKLSFSYTKTHTYMKVYAPIHTNYCPAIPQLIYLNIDCMARTDVTKEKDGILAPSIGISAF